MQTVNVSAYSLQMVLRECAKGYNVAGYTVRPGFSNGLFIYARQMPAGYVGR